VLAALRALDARLDGALTAGLARSADTLSEALAELLSASH
jgi:hypothetical protein